MRCGEKGHRWGTCWAAEKSWEDWNELLREKKHCSMSYQEGHWWRECRKTEEEWEEWKRSNVG
jgi:hypothetical protein